MGKKKKLKKQKEREEKLLKAGQGSVGTGRSGGEKPKKKASGENSSRENKKEKKAKKAKPELWMPDMRGDRREPINIEETEQRAQRSEAGGRRSMQAEAGEAKSRRGAHAEAGEAKSRRGMHAEAEEAKSWRSVPADERETKHRRGAHAEETELAAAAERFRALGDANRLQILDLLLEKEQCAGDLLNSLSIVQSTLSHHMKILVETGLVKCRKQGKWSYYSIDSGMLREIEAYLGKWS